MPQDLQVIINPPQQINSVIALAGVAGAGQNLVGSAGAKGDKGDKGDTGNVGLNGINGWTPSLSLEKTANGVFVKVIDWTGSTGTKPPINVYVGANGFVNDIVDATNVKGNKGDSGGTGVFLNDIIISLTGTKTIGRYGNGDVIPATGKTANEVLLMAAVEPIAPTVTLTSATSILFNTLNVSVALSFTKVVNSLGATIASTSLEFRRNNTGAWTVLSADTNITSFTHTFTQAAFLTTPINYRYVVVDSVGATATALFNITPQAYAAPTINVGVAANSLNGTQSNLLREIGNIISVLSSSILSNRANVPLVSAIFERSLNGGAWTAIGTATPLSGLNGVITAFTHNDASMLSATTIQYRVVVVDSFTTSISSVVTVSFRNISFLGYNANTALTSADAYALGNKELLTTRARTVNGVTAGVGLFTYIVYPTSFGALANIIQNGATPVLGAFTLINSFLVITNQYNVASTYIVYKSNATNAFTNDNLVIS